MNVELINTGAELLLGRVLNTHQQWLCRRLSDCGYIVSRQVAVSDNASAIREAVSEATQRAKIIICTGGLGPTSDDRTRDAIAELLQVELRFDDQVLKHIEAYFAGRKRPMPASTRVQAMVPIGGKVLMNAHGTAPGLVIDLRQCPAVRCSGAQVLIMLPGPPRELRPMFAEQVLPRLVKDFAIECPFISRTLKTTGIGESRLEEMIAPRLEPLVKAGLELGYCARIGEVDVRLSARGAEAERLVEEARQITGEVLRKFIFGTEDEELEEVIVKLLTQRQKTLSLAESCTGGFVANRLTNVPGASAVLWGCAVTYANDAKTKLLGVKPETLEQHGAVSEPTAREMAHGAREKFGTDYAMAVTGIAGPSGGTAAKPVGTVYIALASKGRTRVYQQFNPHDRETFKYVTSQQMLEILRRELLRERA